jgi:hypothetical protein
MDITIGGIRFDPQRFDDIQVGGHDRIFTVFKRYDDPGFDLAHSCNFWLKNSFRD